MRFIVDVNLPKYFRFFNSPEFVFASDIDARMKDSRLWDYALEHNLIILTKDTDFYSRSIMASKKPRIVYFNIGNSTLEQLHQYFHKNWKTILELISDNYLIVATVESIDVIL